MYLRGGYQTLDLTGVYSESGVCTIDGIYEKAKTVKAKLIGGTLTGGVQLALQEQYLPFVESSGSYVGTLTIGAETYTITIADDDTVTIAAA